MQKAVISSRKVVISKSTMTHLKAVISTLKAVISTLKAVISTPEGGDQHSEGGDKQKRNLSPRAPVGAKKAFFYFNKTKYFRLRLIVICSKNDSLSTL